MQPISTYQDQETKELMFNCECGNQVLGSSDRGLCPECEKVTEHSLEQEKGYVKKDLQNNYTPYKKEEEESGEKNNG